MTENVKVAKTRIRNSVHNINNSIIIFFSEYLLI